MSARVVHFEVPFDDADRARAFYRDVFDWEIQPVPEMGYNMVSTGPVGEQGPTEPGYIGGGMMQRQAAMLSYNDVFLMLAVLFILLLPLVMIMRKPSHARGGMGAAH